MAKKFMELYLTDFDDNKRFKVRVDANRTIRDLTKHIQRCKPQYRNGNLNFFTLLKPSQGNMSEIRGYSPSVTIGSILPDIRQGGQFGFRYVPTAIAASSTSSQQAKQEQIGLEDMPGEILERITTGMDPRSKSQLRKTSTTMRQIIPPQKLTLIVQETEAFYMSDDHKMIILGAVYGKLTWDDRVDFKHKMMIDIANYLKEKYDVDEVSTEIIGIADFRSNNVILNKTLKEVLARSCVYKHDEQERPECMGRTYGVWTLFQLVSGQIDLDTFNNQVYHNHMNYIYEIIDSYMKAYEDGQWPVHPYKYISGREEWPSEEGDFVYDLRYDPVANKILQSREGGKMGTDEQLTWANQWIEARFP